MLRSRWFPFFLLVLLWSVLGAGEANPLAPYPAPAEMTEEIFALARAFPGWAEVTEFGASVEGRPLLVLFIHRAGETAKPAAWIGAAIHGNEWIGNRLAMGIARWLLENYGRDPLATDALAALNFYIAPCLNPDGYQRTWEDPHPSDLAALARTRKNAHGVDLNRNFPLPGKVTIPIDWAGSPDPDSPHYRGPHPLSEPESQAIDRFFHEHPEIIAVLSFHATAAVIYPPHCASRECVRRHKQFSKAYQTRQTYRRYPRLQSRFFDTYTGELEDWLYARYGVIAADVEIGSPALNRKACHCDDYFWTYNPLQPQVWIENDRPAAISALLAALRITGGKRIPPEQR